MLGRSAFFSLSLLFCCAFATDERFVTFATVKGFVNSVARATIVEGLNSFDECALKCRFSNDCIVATQNKSTEPCYLFPYGSIQVVNKTTCKTKTKEARTAFRVLAQTCEVDNKVFLKDKLYMMNIEEPEKKQYELSTQKKGWTVSYLEKEVDCGWFDAELSANSCRPECLTRMVFAKLKPGIIYGVLRDNFPYMIPQPDAKNLTTREECNQWCFKNPECALITWWGLSPDFECFYVPYNFSWAPFWQSQTTDSAGTIKVETNETTCKLTNAELMNGKTYTTRNASKVTNYYINSTGRYIVVAFQNTTDCFTNWTAVENPKHCIMPMRTQINMAFLRFQIEYCQAFGGTVAPLTYENKELLNEHGNLFDRSQISWTTGRSFIGIDATTEGLRYFDKSYVADGNYPTNFWALGYPKDLDMNHHCTFMNYSKNGSPIELINGPCTDNYEFQADGFSCVTKRFSELQKLAWSS